MRIEITESEDNLILEDIDMIFPEIGSDNLFLHISHRKEGSTARRGINIVFDDEMELMNFILKFHMWIVKTGEKGIQGIMDLALKSKGL